MIQTDKRFKFTICLLIMQALPSSAQVERTRGESLLQMLEDNIRLHEKHNESKNTQKNTVFRITGEAYELDDFCQIYDSLHGHSNPEEMLSIITIRDIHVNKPYSSEDYMQYFIKGIQEYINQNEDIVLQNSLSITVNCVKRAHITEFEHLNINLEHIYEIQRRVYEYIIEHFYDICLDGLKDVIAKPMRIRFLKQKRFFATQTTINEAKIYKVCDKDFDRIVKEYKLFISDADFYKELEWSYTAKGSAFDVLYTGICDYEKNLGLCHFTKNSPDLEYLYKYFIRSECGEFFRDSLNDLASKYLALFQLQNSKIVFIKHYMALCVFFLKKFEDRRQLDWDTYICKADDFFADDYFTSEIQSFFTEIQSDDIQKDYIEKYQGSLDILRQKITPENVTKIVFNGHIDDEKISLLIDMMQKYQVFDKPYRHQTVYIDSGRGLTDIEALACAKKCNELVFECSNLVKTVELISIISPTLEALSSTPLKCFKHKKEVIGTSDKFRQSYINIYQAPNETKVSISNFYDAGFETYQTINHLMSICTLRNDSTPVDSKMAAIENNLTSSFVTIFLHKHNKTKQEIISLIYDMSYADQSALNTDTRCHNRCIRCLDNAPIIFLKKLLMSIQSAQLFGNAQYTNQNIASLVDYDLTFLEYYKSNYFPQDYCPTLHYCSDYFIYRIQPKTDKHRFSSRDIVKYERSGEFENNALVKLANSFEISHSDFNKILSKFLSYKNNDRIGTYQKIDVEQDTYRDFYCRLAYHDSGDDNDDDNSQSGSGQEDDGSQSSDVDDAEMQSNSEEDGNSHSNDGEEDVNSHSNDGEEDGNSHSNDGEEDDISHSNDGEEDVNNHSNDGEEDINNHSNDGEEDDISHSNDGEEDGNSHSSGGEEDGDSQRRDCKSIILHMAETKDNYYILNAKNNPIKNLSRIIEFAESTSSIQQIEHVMKKLGSKTTFLRLVLCDICNQTKYFIEPNYEYFLTIEKEDCLDIILKQIENVLQTLLNKSRANYNSRGDLLLPERRKLQDLQKSIVPQEMKAFADVIAQEINHNARSLKTKTMSVQLKKRNDDSFKKTELIDSQEIYEQYEDLKIWERVDLEEKLVI